MQNVFYGYMRVSTVEQNEARQRFELLKWGILPKNLYMDKLSGKDFQRPNYIRLRKKLKNGDVLVVKSIDRLGRSYRDIQEEWRYIVKEVGADIVIIDMPLLDTRTNKDLIGTLISDIVLQLLSYVAEAERENIRQRQAEGIAIALKNGVHFGRPSEPIPDGFPEIYRRWKSKELSPAEAIKISGMTPNRFYWMTRKYRLLQKGRDDLGCDKE